MTNSKGYKARLIAYYLPQFHPVPENDEHWGKGFTEWTNVAKAKPLFKGHYQPFLPTELGYYDLRLPDVQKAQADLAREYGIEGFCYWHYWFGGKRVLEMPFTKMVESGEPDFPFCLCWANHSWSAIWVGDEKKIIIEQTYPGVEDYTNHFYKLLPAFKDKRYIKVDGKLLFSIWAPKSLPDCKEFTSLWNQLADKENLPGFHFVAMGVIEGELQNYGLNAYTTLSPHPLVARLPPRFLDKIFFRLFNKNFITLKAELRRQPKTYDYEDIVNFAIKQEYSENEYPVVLPNWDHTPRSGKKGFVLHNSTPKAFGRMLKHSIDALQQRDLSKRIVFVKSWNEWAEGNFLEPEAKFGRGYLEEIKRLNAL